MNKHFTQKSKRSLLLAMLLMSTFLSSGALAQSTVISGRVSDVDGSPIPGVNVIVKGTSTGTSSDASGQYTLTVSNADAILVFSFIGYATQEIALQGKTSADIVLQPDTRTLEEVIVVGYGAQFQKEITGAVQQVKAEELKDIPVAQITQKLQGRLAGVQINQLTGKPGQGMSVRVRGQVSILAGSDPLYVVDGFPIVGGINNLNPDEIESISVLKDAASTSLYGSRAANGVVLVQTKRGKQGQTSVNLNAFYGVQEVPEKGRPKMMNGQEFAQFQKESYEDRGVAVPAAFQNPAQYGAGYDWYGGMLRTAPIQNYSVSVSTGGERSSTSVVMGYFNQEGVLHNSDYTRYSLRLNTDNKIGNKVRTGFNVAPTYAIDNTPSSDGAFYATNIAPTTPGGLLYNSLLTWPILPYKNPDGSLPLTAYIPGVSAFPTPNWYRALEEITAETKTMRLLSNAYVELDLIKDLTFKSTINIDLGNTALFYFQPSTASSSFASLPPAAATLFRRNERYVSWLNENTVMYKKEVGDHKFDLLVGYTTQKYRLDAEQLRATDFPDGRVPSIQSAVNIDRTQTNSDVQEWSLISYPARLNYNFKGKYLLSLSVRRDGSSRFGADNRWGTFSAVSAGWVVSDEGFMPESGNLSFLKLRASYGVVGNNNIGNYTQYATVSTTTTAIFGSTITPGASVTSLANSNLGWETTKQLDVGFDLGLFNDRINIGYDYYQKNTTNLLYNVAVPQESGFTNFNGNIGEIKFWGHEVSVASKNLSGTLKWNTDANIAFNRNEVVALSEGVNRLYGGPGVFNTITMVGQPLGQFYGLIHEGVYVSQADFDSSPKAVASEVGTIKYRDYNNDGVITYGGDNDDRTIIGNPFPKFVYGITNNFSYKSIDLSIVGAGAYGHDILVMTDQGTTNLDGPFNVLADVKNRWRSPENPGNGRYGKTTSATFMERDWESTRFVSKGNYFTIKNITIGYTVPLKSKVLRTLRAYGSVQQLYAFTNYRGANPETSSAQNGTTPNALSLGMDWGAYPVPRTYTFGLNFGL